MSTEDDDHLRLMDSDDEDEDGRWSGAFELVFGKEAREPQHEQKTDNGARNWLS